MADLLHSALKLHFGLDSFRVGQESVIRSVAAGRDVLAVMPTGGGKSICFQLPAMMRPGITIVVSPLIALMVDQIAQLERLGIPAATLNSTMKQSEVAAVMERLRSEQLKLLYLAPERALSRPFLDEVLPMLMQRSGVGSLVVDEAHCVSTWGHDFRPEYRMLKELREACPGVPMSAFTATATERVRKDIVTELKLDRPFVYVASFNRPNLFFRVRQKTPDIIDDIVQQVRGQGSGIVYCSSRRRTEEVATKLNAAKIRAVAYHAGLKFLDRKRSQEDFIDNQVQVICATIAFGMGVNKPDIRWVIHHDLPSSMEAYYQETGRAGRDGKPAECTLYFSRRDVDTARYLIGKRVDATTGLALVEEQAIAIEQLDKLVSYATQDVCRRKVQLAYFGERIDKPCGACDVCKGQSKVMRGTDASSGLSLRLRPRFAPRGPSMR